MGVFDFITKYRERRDEKKLAEAKRTGVLIEKLNNWACEDPGNRVVLVCMSAVIGTHLGMTGMDIGRTEAHFQRVMTECVSEESLEEPEG